MQFGLKNRLRLISLLPIVILFSITSYFVYNSYENYKAAQLLQDRLTANRELNSLVNNISRERGMTVMYLGNSSANTLKSLVKQRAIVDKQAKSYFEHIDEQALKANSTVLFQEAKKLKDALQSIVEIRHLVDEQKTNFQDVYEKVYGSAQVLAIGQLEEITDNQVDPQINDYSFKYITFVRANEFTAAERDFISFAIARSTELDEEEVNKWINLVSKADA
ncbi:MAG: nitrate- and nitrite sensing domain-containing protein, partial [Campylobacterales bacterium]|nr:nitrate- and nitrite sensing domain-containing protein [Campylobacterales bacterium]